MKHTCFPNTTAKPTKSATWVFHHPTKINFVMMKRFIPIILVLISSLQTVYSQIFQEYYQNREDSSLTSGNIYLDLSAATWFYNNEYFNPFYKGYSLIGGTAQPKIVYQLNPKLKLSAGANFQRYYGDNENTRTTALFNIEYRPQENFSLLMGSFNGGENHRLSEVLFSFENHLVDLIENGILIRYDNPMIRSETWLNWESFIMPGDTFQEQFTAGSSNIIRFSEVSSWKFSIPVALLAHHSGGQINNNNEHVETLINISEGINISRKINSKPENEYYAEFRVFHSIGDFVPSSGWAISAKTGIQLTHIEFNAEYFRGNDFVSFAGNPLFHSWKTSSDPLIPFKYGGIHEMLNFKAGIKQKIGTNSFMFLRFESYYFPASARMDYSYSLHFQVRDFIKLK